MKYCYHCMAKIEDNNAFYCPECGNKCSEHFAQSNELPAGTFLCNNRYLVGVSLGSGGFGISYIGYDIKLEKKVLVKETFYHGIFKRNCYDKNNGNPLWVTYGENFSLDEIMQKTQKECMFLSEGEDLSGIVKVYDWFSENNTAYIITEFINGVTLYDRVFEKGHYLWQDLYGKIKPLMFGLASLHEKQLLHRDIKPQNIMIKNLKYEGEKFILIDFGLARSLEAKTLASVGVSFSPGYSPYEQRSFLKIDNTYTDVYSLAATIYFALTGEDPNTEFCDTVEGNFPKINVLNSKYGVPQNVVNALKWALAPNYEQRCQTVTDFINALDSDSAYDDNNSTADSDYNKEPLPEKNNKNTKKVGIICGLAAMLCLAVLIPVMIHGGSDSQDNNTSDSDSKNDFAGSYINKLTENSSVNAISELSHTDSEVIDTNTDTASDKDSDTASDTEKNTDTNTSGLDNSKKSDSTKTAVPLVVGKPLSEAKVNLTKRGLNVR